MLRHGSGTRGQQRAFVVVAARTATAQRWMPDNVQADIDGDSFDRGAL